MAYIGKTPITGNFVKLDAISVVNGQAAYTMNNGGSAFTDYENVNQFLVSLNGILQAPTDSFTVSGSTLTFASNLATGDVIDFVIVLGNTLDIGTPSDATVTQAKTNFVSTSSAAGLQIKGDGTTDGTLQLNCSQNSHGIKLKSPAHSAAASYTLTFPTTDGNNEEFLQTNGSGVLTWASAGGASTLISTTNVTSGTAQVDITGMDSTYKMYEIRVINLHPATDNVTLNCQYIIGGSAQTGAHYDYCNWVVQRGGTTGENSSYDATSSKLIHSSQGNTPEENLSGIIRIFNPSETTFRKMVQAHISYINTSAASSHSSNTTYYNNNTSAVTGLRLFFSSGNIDNGIFKLYGIS